jgi:8-oxo-dGTP pyrophosphatase MutT (NUDIX family)
MSPTRSWKNLEEETVFSVPFVSISRTHSVRDGDGRRARFYRLHFPDWANIFAITPEDEVVFVHQFRQGVMEYTLELPGGVMEPGEDPLEGARRELVEETGYTSDEWITLGPVYPNPAIQDNRCTTFIARNARRTHPTDFDTDEELEIETIPLAQVAERTLHGQVTNAVIVAGLARALAALGVLQDRR